MKSKWLITVRTEWSDSGKLVELTCGSDKACILVLLSGNQRSQINYGLYGATRLSFELLVDIYTELYVTAGGDVNINKQHEVIQMEVKPTTEESIQPCDMFKPPSGKGRSIRTVLTNGIAGIGKTFLVQKFVLDWTNKENNQDVHLIFPFTFRQLNLWKDEKLSITKESSGNTNYDKSKFKLVFVLDGLDESRLQLNCSTNKNKGTDFDVTQFTSVDVLMSNLIQRNLLPSARLWITTRPAAANQIHSDFVDVFTEVRGFTDPQKEEYFRKRFRDEEQASRIISHIKTSRSLHIMCHIPVFCWITATVLLKTREGGELPKTLTEMYVEFLSFQNHQTNEKFDQNMCIQYIKSLAKLAFHQLEKGNVIFYERDLEESGIDVRGASLFSGVFTEIFKEERGRKNDEVKMFSFVHLSVQEFLAALYVEMSLINKNKNVMSELAQTIGKHVGMFFSKTSVTNVHRFAIDKALQSPNGHLDLFLRFLLGLSLQTNQTLPQGLLKKNRSLQTNQKTVEYIKKKISENLSPERSINLFHCLNELNDGSLEEEIQQYLRSGSLSTDKLSPAQWSALVFILLSSEEDLDVFDLKKYSVSEEVLLRLLPKQYHLLSFRLSGCNLSDRSCEALSSVLIPLLHTWTCGTSPSHLDLRYLSFTHLDLWYLSFTLGPVTPLLHTPGPAVPLLHTPGPVVPLLHTPGPVTPLLHTPGPVVPLLHTPGPVVPLLHTLGPVTPLLHTPGPAVPLLHTPGSAVPLLHTPGPAVPLLHTPGPAVPLLHTPGPVTPLLHTPGPVVPLLHTPGPVVPLLHTLGPVTPLLHTPGPAVPLLHTPGPVVPLLHTWTCDTSPSHTWTCGTSPSHTWTCGTSPSHTWTCDTSPSHTWTCGTSPSHTWTCGTSPSHTWTCDTSPSHTWTCGTSPSHTWTCGTSPSHTWTCDTSPSHLDLWYLSFTHLDLRYLSFTHLDLWYLSFTPGPVVPLLHTPGPAVPLLHTPGPAVPLLHTPGPAVPLLHTPGPVTPLLHTPGPVVPLLHTPGPVVPLLHTPGPVTPLLHTPGPVVPLLHTPGPVVPLLHTLGPVTPLLHTPGPVTPLLHTPGPAVPLLHTPGPAVPLLHTPGPVTPLLHTPGPVVPLLHTPGPAVPLLHTLGPVTPLLHTPGPVVPLLHTPGPVVLLLHTPGPVVPLLHTLGPVVPLLHTLGPVTPLLHTPGPVVPLLHTWTSLCRLCRPNP
uniref:NACHT domain-containing protein n=1 Tax=Sparus aurata TaxID=8175 RepID=A0A671VLC4_SPAAU